MDSKKTKKSHLTPQKKKELDKAVSKAVKQYKETFDLLAKT